MQFNSLKESPSDKNKCIFVDESGFNMHIYRSQARSREGKRAPIVLPKNRGRNVTLIAAMSNAGVVFSKIFDDRTVNSVKLEMFFKETKVHFIDIEEGMILSRPLFNIEGKMLLNSDYKITKEIIVRLFKHHKVIPIKSPFYVYTKAPEKTFNFEEFLAKKINKAVA